MNVDEAYTRYLLSDLEERIEVKFQNRANLVTALTRKSFLNENKVDWESNERLAFLGDSVLQLIVSEQLYTKNREGKGILTELRKEIVNDDVIAEKAKNLNIEHHILRGEGEARPGLGREFYANIYEALVGAVYLDTRCLAGVQLLLNRIDELQCDGTTGFDIASTTVAGPEYARHVARHILLN